MATKILRVFQEFTSEGYVPMPPAGNIDYGYTIAGTFPSTTPATFQTDNPDLEVTVTEVTDFYVWIRSHGTEWNYQYTRNVRVYPDSPSINNVVMGIIIANLGNTVPYTGATKNVNLGEFGITQGYSKFDLTPTNTPTTAGTMSWNDGDGTLDLILKGGNVTLQLGQELVARCFNAEATTLNDGEIVYIYGSQGNRVSVKRASASSEMSSSVTFGMVTEHIASGAEGFVTISGVVNKLNTSGLTAGTALWLGTTPGTYTPTKPTAPIHSVLIGYVERVHATVGSIYVKVQNGYELNELHNVKITTPTENDFLVYDDTQQVWENRAVIKANGYIPYFDSTDLFKQSPILVDGVNVTMNGMPLLLSDEGQLNYITKFGSTKTVINSLLYDTGVNVGLGTTNPLFKFHIQGGDLGIYNSSTAYGYQIYTNGNYRFGSATGFQFLVDDVNTGTVQVRIDTLGRLGVGVVNPAYKVDVNGDVNTNGIYRINGSPLSTSNIAEGTNLYFTSNRVLGQVLTGLNVSLTGVVTAADSLIVGISKLQNQVSSIVSGVSSVFGRTGAVTAQSGDYTTTLVTEGTNLYYTQARFDSAFGAKSTTNLTEGTNLYYTDARARLALSAGTGISYNNTTGVISYSGTVYTDSSIRALFSAGSGINYNNTTGVITSTITQYTDAMARASLSFVAGSGAYNSTTGVITIPTNTNQLTNGANYITLASLSASSPLSYNSGTGAFSISQASGITNGFLSSTDWNIFNNKQNALGYTPVPNTRTITINGTTQDLSADRTFTVAGTISGLTTNYVTKATSATTIGNSLIYDNGSKIGIGTTSPIGYSADDLVLQIYNSATSGSAMRSMLRFTNTTTGTAFGGGSFLGIDSTLDLYVVNSSNANIQFQTNGLERLRITSTGNVGIGTSSPSELLHLYTSLAGSSGVGTTLKIESGGAGGDQSWIGLNKGSGNGLTFSIENRDFIWKTGAITAFGGTERMRLTSSGNLGLGVTPSAWDSGQKVLQVGLGSFYGLSDGGATVIVNNGYYNAGWKYSSTSSAGVYQIVQNSHQWLIAGTGTAGTAISFTQAMTLDASGNLLLGATSQNGTSSRAYLRQSSDGIFKGLNIVSASSGQFVGGISIDGSGNFNFGQSYLDGSGSYQSIVFTTSGLERLRINASGNVSIGNTNNTYKLDVSGTGRFTGLVTIGNGTDSAFLISNRGTTSQNNGILLQTANSSNWIIGSGGGGANSNFDFYNYLLGTSVFSLNYFTGAATFSSSVTAGGNITSGGGAYDIGGFFLPYSTASTASRNWKITNDQINFGDFTIKQSSTQTGSPDITRFYISPAGNVGIGTTSPSVGILHLNYNSVNNRALRLQDQNGIFDIITSGASQNHSFGLYDETNGAYRLFVLNNGNAGIGTTSPLGKLHVQGEASGQSIRTDHSTAYSFLYSTISNANPIALDNNAGNLIIYTGSTERMRITSTGAVGIATNNPTGIFQVAGSGNIFFGDTPSNTNYKFNVKGFSGNYISFWTPTLSGVNQNGIMSHSGAGLGALTPLGYYASTHVFGGEVTGGGLVQVAGDVNISGTFRVNGTAIGTGGGGVSGSGTTGYHAKWSSATSLTNSIINESGDEVGVNGSNFPRFTFKSGATYRGMIGINTDNLFWIASAGSTELILSTNSLGRINIKGDGKILFNSSTGANLILEATGGSDSALYTTLNGNLRAVARFTQDLTIARGIGFGYDAGDQLGFVYGTTSGSTASKLGLVIYNGSSWVNMLIAKSNTINLPSLPTSTSGLVFGDLYVDANGFVKRYNVV